MNWIADTGARAVNAILAEPDFVRTRGAGPEVLDVAIVGAGVSGIAAAIQARKAGLTFQVFEAAEVFSTVANFPKAKPIYTYPTDMTPAGDLQFKSEVHPKEERPSCSSPGPGPPPRLPRPHERDTDILAGDISDLTYLCPRARLAAAELDTVRVLDRQGETT